MNDENFKKLFIATHLLYPNSAQARDIVFQISTQLRSKISKSGSENELLIYYTALVQIYKKVISIKSGFKFFEFKDQKLNDWQNILKKCNSNEVLIFLAIAILKLDIASISQIMKISVNQTYYLFGLAIRKAIGTNDAKQLLTYTFQYKKFNEKQNTYSNLVEKAVEYMYLKPAAEHSFENFMSLYGQDVNKANSNAINFVYKKIESLYLEVNQIEIDEKFLEEFQKETHEYFESQKFSYKIEWKYTGLIFIASCSLLFFYLKPNFGNLLNFYEGYSVIEIKEIAFRNPETDQNKVALTEDNALEQSKSPSGAELLVAKLTEPKPTIVPGMPPAASNSVTESAKPSPPVATAPALPAQVKPTVATNSIGPITPPGKTTETQVPPAAATAAAVTETATTSAPAQAENKANQPKMVGGVYRAELHVKDFEQNTLFTKEKIITYGGKKAGEVELGWIKNNKTSYFHFFVPEENVEKLKSDLGLLGRLEISFHNHPRLMPAGTKRVILEVRLVD